MRLDQVEPIRQAIFFRWAPLASARHAVVLADNETLIDGGGVALVEHHPIEEAKEISLGLKERQPARVRCAAVKSKRVGVLDVSHGSLLSEKLRSS